MYMWVFIYRKYASAAVLERNVERAVESFASGVERHEDDVIDVPQELMRMVYNFLATMCFGKMYTNTHAWTHSKTKLSVNCIYVHVLLF